MPQIVLEETHQGLPKTTVRRRIFFKRCTVLLRCNVEINPHHWFLSMESAKRLGKGRNETLYCAYPKPLSTSSDVFDHVASEWFTMKMRSIPNMLGQHGIRVTSTTRKSELPPETPLNFNRATGSGGLWLPSRFWAVNVPSNDPSTLEKQLHV